MTQEPNIPVPEPENPTATAVPAEPVFTPDPTKFGLVHTINLSSNSLPCYDEKCRRPIKKNEPYFVDAATGDGLTYCDSCGKCLRYARKKQAQREEARATAGR